MNNAFTGDYDEKPDRDEHDERDAEQAEHREHDAEHDEREYEHGHEHDEHDEHEHNEEHDTERGEHDWRSEPEDTRTAEAPGGPYDPDEPDLPEGPLADLPHGAAAPTGTAASESAAGSSFGSASEAGSEFGSASATGSGSSSAIESGSGSGSGFGFGSEPLLTSTSAEAFLDRWSGVQAAFIEDPHRSVTEADALLTEVLTAYQEAIEQRREQISSAWSGNTTDTEKMRLALLDYRNVITGMLPTQNNTTQNSTETVGAAANA